MVRYVRVRVFFFFSIYSKQDFMIGKGGCPLFLMKETKRKKPEVPSS